MDKLTLSESSRRSLQVILSQHKAWVLETSKFISTSSENIPTGKLRYSRMYNWYDLNWYDGDDNKDGDADDWW